MAYIESMDLDTEDFEQEELYEISQGLLEDRYFEEALEVSDALLALQYTGGFEIKARVLAEQRNYEEAIAVLREAIQCAPTIAIFWDLLGRYEAEEGRLEEARDCFKQALTMDPEMSSLVYIHWATVELNFENLVEARTYAELATDAAYRDDGQLLMMRLLWAEGNLGQAYELGRDILRRDEGENPAWRATVAANVGQLCLQMGNRGDAESLAREACMLDNANDYAQWLVRDLHGQMSNDATMFSALFEGVEEGEDGPMHYIQRYDITADNEADALRLAREYLTLSGLDGLTLNSITSEYPRPATMAGVYEVSPKHYFDPDGEDDDE